MSSLKKAIFSTLAYADVFDYPLDDRELHRFLIADKSQSFSSFKKSLASVVTDERQIGTDGFFYFLEGRKKIVGLRKRRKGWSEPKLRIAHRVASWLRLIPWIRMVAVTGALAVENSDKDDDIDLLIVTSQNRLWLTRLLAVLLMELVAQRRRPGEKKVKDKICLNMFLDEKGLGLPRKEQNLFTAHEVCQLRPLWSRGGACEKFLRENQWIKKYLPNAMGEIEKLSPDGIEDLRRSRENGEIKREKFPQLLITQLLNYLESLTYRFQLAYMAPRKTTEVVEPHRIRFHPQDCREWVLKEYERRLGID